MQSTQALETTDRQFQTAATNFLSAPATKPIKARTSPSAFTR